MVWFFTRGDDVIKVTTRFDKASSTYVIETQWPDLPRGIERFEDCGEFAARLMELENQLQVQAWSRLESGPQLLDHDEWRSPLGGA